MILRSAVTSAFKSSFEPGFLVSCRGKSPDVWRYQHSFRYGVLHPSTRVGLFRCMTSVKQNPSSESGWKATLDRFLAPKEMPPRHTLAWYKEMLLICTVFAITGSSTMMLVRPAVSNGLGLQGSIKDGPWSYRISSLVIMSPIYGVLLVMIGTLFGRHAYFRHFSVKMFSRFGVPPELMDPTFHQTKKTFRKW